ncbi:hypothetical protein MRX96_021848 [Rhipicephalus microplus]
MEPKTSGKGPSPIKRSSEKISADDRTGPTKDLPLQGADSEEVSRSTTARTVESETGENGVKDHTHTRAGALVNATAVTTLATTEQQTLTFLTLPPRVPTTKPTAGPPPQTTPPARTVYVCPTETCKREGAYIATLS